MKEIDKKDAPEVSGGYMPDGCVNPPLQTPNEYPKYPVRPLPEPVFYPIDPESSDPLK